LVPNRVDARSLEGQQLADELAYFGEVVAPSLGSRSAFVRAFSAGCTVADLAPGRIADNEVKDFTDVVLELLGISPSKRQETYKDRAHVGR
jgi:chromosome partitioning protein